MRLLDKLRLRFRSLLRRPRVEQELDDELRFHIEQQIAENIAAGMTREESRYASRRTIGGLARSSTNPGAMPRDARGDTG
ncbi:MAG: hypothetical protein DMG57_05365 [Acidobacteria bacterium]|nr:MAG: hypothetical protein DMG57_05365 [Acidobacteriota bacterium]